MLTRDQLGYRNGFNAKIAAAEDVWWATQAKHATHCLLTIMRFHGVVAETIEKWRGIVGSAAGQSGEG